MAGYIEYYDNAHRYDELRFDSMVEVETTVAWMLAELEMNDTAPILEVGAGTCRYGSELSRRLDCKFIGVDKSIAQLSRAPTGATTICGDAANIPLRSSSCGVVLAVMMIHQLSLAQLASFLLEARRVLTNGGHLFIKTSSHEDLRNRPLVRYFPGTVNVNIDRYPQIAEVVDRLTRLAFRDIRIVPSITTEVVDSQILMGKVEGLGNTALSLISDAEFRHGAALLRADLSGARSVELQHRHTYVVARAS